MEFYFNKKVFKFMELKKFISNNSENLNEDLFTGNNNVLIKKIKLHLKRKILS